MSDIAYRPLTAAEQIFHDVVIEPLLKAGEAYIEGQVPFLALPVIKQVDEQLLQSITDAAYAQFVLLVDMSAIKFVNSLHAAAFADATVKLKLLALEKGTSSPEYLKEKLDAQAAFAASVRYGATQ